MLLIVMFELNHTYFWDGLPQNWQSLPFKTKMDVITLTLQLFEELIIDQLIKRQEYVEIYQVIIETKDLDQLLWYHRLCWGSWKCGTKKFYWLRRQCRYLVGQRRAPLFKTMQLQVYKIVEELQQYAALISTVIYLVTASDSHSKSMAIYMPKYKDNSNGAADLRQVQP